MNKFILRTLAVLALSMGVSGIAFASHCAATFVRDIGPMMAQPDGTMQTVTEDCTGTTGCSDYFDISMANAANLFTTFCSAGGTANFDTGISIWGPNDPNVQAACNDDTCALLSELAFVAPSTAIYRVRIGGFGGGSGTYTLAYSADPGSNILGAGGPAIPVPTLSEWGQILMVLLLLLSGAVLMYRVRAPSR